MKFILVFGNLAKGFEFIGPFEKEEEALEFAKNYMRNMDFEGWWIENMNMSSPEEFLNTMRPA